jgi:hypothetical protein
MDNSPADRSLILRKRWSAVIWLSALLAQPERDAVLGDLAESGESRSRATANVLGLVVRRHAAILSDLRLWVALALLILPVSFFLSAIAQTTAVEGAVYSWMYLNNWDWALTRNPGFWYVLRGTVTQFGIACLLLACWSWSGGFVVGRLPNEIVRASRNGFVLLLAASQLGDAPARFVRLWMHFHGLTLQSSLPDVHGPITANAFYRVFFPWIVLACLVIWPAISGMRQGNRSLLLGRKKSVVLVTASAISLLTLLIQVPSFGLLFGAEVREWLWRSRNTTQVLSWLACWPTAYVIAMGCRRYRQTNALAQ